MHLQKRVGKNRAKKKDNFLCEWWSCFTKAFQSTSARMNFAACTCRRSCRSLRIVTCSITAHTLQASLSSPVMAEMERSLSKLLRSSTAVLGRQRRKAGLGNYSPYDVLKNHSCSLRPLYFVHRLEQIPLQWASASGQHLYYSKNYLLAWT